MKRTKWPSRVNLSVGLQSMGCTEQILTSRIVLHPDWKHDVDRVGTKKIACYVQNPVSKLL